MQNFYFDVKYDIRKDIDNWLAAAKERNFGGKKWRDGLFGSYLDEFDKISGMSEDESRVELGDFIPKHFGKIIEKKMVVLKKQLTVNILSVCDFVESITDKKLAFKNIRIFLTTFPRAPYSSDENTICFCVFWDDIFRVLIHEMLHMQVYNYWRINKNSLVSKLNKGDYLALNESVTFLVNESDLAERKDVRYPKYEKIRATLENYWKNNCDLGDMLEYGAGMLLGI